MLNRHRYCQALMLARHGRNVVLDAKGISYPAAARAFGFRPLPEPLRTGMYGYPAEVIAHGTPHRILEEHDESKSSSIT